MLKLECFRVGGVNMKLVPSPPDRPWMDAFTDRHAYRCLPLNIANTHGWDVLCPFKISVDWNGGLTVGDIVIKAAKIENQRVIDHVLRSNFSRGIITFHTGFLFRTSPEWNLLASGPFNRPKAGAFPLTGIIETDWLPYPFTMNWQLMAPGRIVFEEDEPICTVMPIPKNYLPDVTPEIFDLKDDPVLAYEQEIFKRERDQFMKRVNAGDAEAIKQGWQRHYFVGRMPDNTKVEGHVNKLRLNLPVDKKGQAAELALKEPRVKIDELPWDEFQKKIPKASAPVQAAKPELHDESQTHANIEGRARIKDGILSPSSNTRYLKPKDYADLDFVVIENFITQEESKLLHDAFLANKQGLHQDVDVDYWKGRILFAHDFAQKNPKVFALMKTCATRTAKAISDFYELKDPVYADTVQMVIWPQGKFMPPHADNCNPDGSPHDMAWRDFGSIIYLNNDYDGGEFYLTGLDMVLKPKAGMLVAVTAGMHHEHAVLKVTKGDRVTLPAFYTFDKARADKTIY